MWIGVTILITCVIGFFTSLFILPLVDKTKIQTLFIIAMLAFLGVSFLALMYVIIESDREDLRRQAEADAYKVEFISKFAEEENQKMIDLHKDMVYRPYDKIIIGSRKTNTDGVIVNETDIDGVMINDKTGDYIAWIYEVVDADTPSLNNQDKFKIKVRTITGNYK